MHMPGSITGTTKWVARILPEGRTDESTTNGCGQAIALAFIALVALFLTHPTAELEPLLPEH
ncbi:hypothetical protein ACHAC9_09420 [Massilia sp. CMS3.1]|uniref:hypothetical protein n=1 Tax=Massilia sp. CMS3.1 TaxID=3373083 RepID=UPI003EE63A61